MIIIQFATTLINPKYKHVLEFGVASGRTISMIRALLDDTFKVYGFDSFYGLPEDWIGNPYCPKGCFSTNGIAPKINGVTIFKGLFEDTIPEYLKEAEPCALIHIDCDLYSSTKTIFKYLPNFIKAGTILVFDEWCYNANINDNEHEQKAFYEFVDDHKIKFEFIDFFDQENPVERKIVKILN
jgi:hypothetical protein